MSKTLGLDLGTNSIGWAIIERDGNSTSLIDKGVHIFQEGVNRVKGNEEPTVKTRTEARASRRHYFRRRLRKIELLKILVEQGWCPYLSDEELKSWKETKLFPLNPDFLEWLRTDDVNGSNPYCDRHRCINEIIDLSDRNARYSLGRALYHINQRRGFLSNRKDQGVSEESGKVKSAIGDLDKEMKDAGFEYLGDYFFHLYETGEHIRRRYTDRKEHYLKEFNAICQKQNIDQKLVQRLYDAIFYQRPLKSQKGSVGKCPFEPSKSRCQISHPDFEEFRMLSFINNIRIARPGDIEMRRLSDEEITAIKPLFFRKSKENFDFADISKKLAGKGLIPQFDNGRGDGNINALRFNFRDSTNVSGCPVTAQFKSIFGEDWKTGISEQYLLAGNKSESQIADDIWHALTFFFDDEKLLQWAKTKLQLTDDEAKSFVDIRIPQGYASLSLCAIRKILPWLRAGYRYDEAAMLANIKAVLPESVRKNEAIMQDVMNSVIKDVASYTPDPEIKNDSKIRKIEEDICNFGIFDIDMGKLYHPSMIDVYPKSKPNQYGKILLGSPRTESIRNPMAMRSLFRLRALVNELIEDGKIDKNTKINIELARNLNDFNTRKAIELLQRNNEKRRAECQKAISQYYAEQNINCEPSEDEILKYELWEEQKHVCLYTGRQIPLSGFLGANPQFDIEHTVPRSRGGDDSKANKTLCESRFNREIKKGRLPSELANRDEVLARLDELDFESKIEGLRKDIAKTRRAAKSAVDKDSKDKAIQRRHVAKMQIDYLSDKVRRFKMRDVPEGFSNRQGVDIGIIGRYARMYLQSVFDKVYTVKGETTAEFRKMWGLQDIYSKKERVNHAHHCIDAITIACIGKGEYDRWAQFKSDEESYSYGAGRRPEMPKPWTTFTEDVKHVSEILLVSHYTADNMLKQTKKVMRNHGVIQRKADGTPKYLKGDTARGSLHLQTFYGAIKKDDEIRYVVRKELSSLAEKDIKNIVDDVVRAKVSAAFEKNGISALQGDVWMNEEKHIPIKKVRLFVPSVTNPLHLKEQRFKSDAEYKREYHVANESNYAMAIYEGKDGKGKIRRSFKLINNLEASGLVKMGVKDIVGSHDEKGYQLLCTLKIGTMVIFYENDREEVINATSEEIAKRLYKTVGLSKMKVKQYEFGSLVFLHHEEARASTEIKYNNGAWSSRDEYRPKIGIYHTQLKALVEGSDFIMSKTGKITFLRND